MDQEIQGSYPHAFPTLMSALQRTRNARPILMRHAKENAEESALAFDADAVLFELGPAAPHWSYDGVRPQLRFTFDIGHAIASFEDAPARGVSCSPGSFMLLSPGMRVRVRHSTPLEILALTFAPGALAGRAGQGVERAAITGEFPGRTIDPGVRALAVEVRRALVEEPRPDRGYMAALGEAMLARALQVIDQEAAPRARVALSPFRLRRVVDHVEARLDSKITVQELAALAELSTAHFARAFRQAMGEAPHQFVLNRRIARVRELLRDPALDLATVALRAGFSSHAHMTSAFRRLMGLAPVAYRAGMAGRRAS
jgi:AraC family transcriptional regulator